VSILSDVRAVRRVIRNAVRSRATRAELAERVPPVLQPGTIQIAVYFADTRVNLYQIRQWYAPLAELAKRHPVAIITRSPGATLTLLDESPVPVVYRRRVIDLEEFVAQQDLRLVLYVNQNQKNFQMFRYGRMWHVFVNHGESDKMYMTTNQFKAYDYALVAGQAALDRLSRKLWAYDVEHRAIPIGRPQADHFGPPPPTARSRRTVRCSPPRCSLRPATGWSTGPTRAAA
jgi:hypothetical protein